MVGSAGAWATATDAVREIRTVRGNESRVMVGRKDGESTQPTKPMCGLQTFAGWAIREMGAKESIMQVGWAGRPIKPNSRRGCVKCGDFDPSEAAVLPGDEQSCSEPFLIADDVGFVELFVGLGQVDDPLDD